MNSNPIVTAINLGSIAAIPGDYITTKLGLNKITDPWDFLRLKYAKHFGFGLEVRGNAPYFNSSAELKSSAEEAVSLALKRYGDMLIDATVRVKEGELHAHDDLVLGYNIDPGLDWDFSKPVLLETTYDSKNRSYRIMGVVYEHLIDGVPLALFMQLIHNHLVLGKDSLLNRSTRTFPEPYSYHADTGAAIPDRDKWQDIHQFDASRLIPVGSQIDVTGSAVTKLRKKIMEDISQKISTSSLEAILLSLEMGMTWITDYIARGHQNNRQLVDAQKGYHGLGNVRMKVMDNIHKADARRQYEWICRVLEEASFQTKLERHGRGQASRFYERYRKIPSFFVNLFDRRISYDDVMAVAGTQLIVSNLNGIDYGVPIFVGGIRPDDVRFIFVPSHGEHGKKTQAERAKRSLETHVTEVSFSCGPKITATNGRSLVYKSLKVSPQKARDILLEWGHSQEQVMSLTPSERVREVFMNAYRPDTPREGRIEKRASLYLDL